MGAYAPMLGIVKPRSWQTPAAMPTTQQIARTIASECACLRLRGAARSLTRDYDAELRAAGIKLSQLSVLVAVAMFGERGAAMKPLAEAIAMDRTTLTRNLRPLIDADWLRLSKSETDGRSRTVTLTQGGAELLERAFPLWKRAQISARKRLGPEHFTALAAELDHLQRPQR